MELGFVDWLRQRLPASPHVRIGVGDDAALLDLPSGQLVTTADLLIDGVHFLTAEHAPERIGRKALAVNLSDLAAMAARPVGAVVSLALPRDGAAGLDNRELAARLIEGMLPLAEEFSCPIVGGDTNVGPGPLAIAVTAFGESTERGVVRRDGAQPGDAICVTGLLGGSLAGKHLDFTPRVKEALAIHERVELHSMMDLSDGLSLDLQRLCEASGVGAILEEDSIPIAEEANPDVGRALSDGEDFELLFTLPEHELRRLIDAPPLGVTPVRIGTITYENDLFIRDECGARQALLPQGYEHR